MTSRRARFVTWLARFAIACFLLSVGAIIALLPPVWELERGPIAVVRWPKSGEQVFQIGPGSEHWVPIAAVSKHVIHAIVVAEDARFYEHSGLDWREIRSSIAFNMEQKRYARGASTITQQVVKMAFLSSDKNLLRKLREALGALLLETLLSKDRILEWYINLVEFGDGVFGIKAAAQHFFDTEPELLTIQDGAHLALVLPSPNRWSKGLRQRELTEFGHRRYAHIIREMHKLGFITETLKESALATGDFGRPVLGFRRETDPTESGLDPYWAIPGNEP
ncbi:MAG: transglycosylase domain-containing protein, partial [Oligoflexus sp.]